MKGEPQISWEEMLASASNVPCGGCTACCKKQHIMLFVEEGDDPKEYKLKKELLRDSSGVLRPVVAQKENGDCVYLGEQGCTIHASRPHICRTYDCRLVYLLAPEHMREYIVSKDEKIKAGQERADTLGPKMRSVAEWLQKSGIVNFVEKNE